MRYQILDMTNNGEVLGEYEHSFTALAIWVLWQRKEMPERDLVVIDTTTGEILVMKGYYYKA